MNHGKQKRKVQPSKPLQPRWIFLFNYSAQSVVANRVWQLNQQFKQSSYNNPFSIVNLNPCITRIRLVMHDACILCVQSITNNLEQHCTSSHIVAPCTQHELYFWKLEHTA